MLRLLKYLPLIFTTHAASAAVDIYHFSVDGGLFVGGSCRVGAKVEDSHMDVKMDMNNTYVSSASSNGISNLQIDMVNSEVSGVVCTSGGPISQSLVIPLPITALAYPESLQQNRVYNLPFSLSPEIIAAYFPNPADIRPDLMVIKRTQARKLELNLKNAATGQTVMGPITVDLFPTNAPASSYPTGFNTNDHLPIKHIAIKVNSFVTVGTSIQSISTL